MLSQAWSDLTAAVATFISRPAAKPFNVPVTAQPGPRTILSSQEFTPEASYFSIRLVEMNIAEGGKFFSDFLPVGVCLSEYTYGTDRQRRPMILSNDMIAEELAKSHLSRPGYIEYRNMYAVRLAPVKADNLSLFVGLFRMEYSDLAKQILQLAADVTDQVVAPGISQGIRVAEKIYDRVAGLFKLKGMIPLFGHADGNALTASGYFVIGAPSKTTIDSKALQVIDDRLHVVDDAGARLASGFDYCLIAIEHTSTLLPLGDTKINPLVSLPFHKSWMAIAQMITKQQLADAAAAMPQLRADVVASPDLTEEDRLLAVSAYDTAFEKYRLTFAPRPDATRAGTRGAEDDRAIDGREREARERRDAGQVAVGDALQAIADELRSPDADGLPDPGTHPDALFLQSAASIRTSLTPTAPISAGAAAQLAESIPRAYGRGLDK